MNFKFEIFYSFIEVTAAHSQVTWPSNFPSYSCGTLENWCGRLEGRMAHLEDAGLDRCSEVQVLR